MLANRDRSSSRGRRVAHASPSRLARHRGDDGTEEAGAFASKRSSAMGSGGHETGRADPVAQARLTRSVGSSPSVRRYGRPERVVRRSRRTAAASSARRAELSRLLIERHLPHRAAARRVAPLASRRVNSSQGARGSQGLLRKPPVARRRRQACGHDELVSVRHRRRGQVARRRSRRRDHGDRRRGHGRRRRDHLDLGRRRSSRSSPAIRTRPRRT